MSEPEEFSNDPLPADTRPAGREKAMGFWGHLEELRWTLIKCAVVFTLFAVAIGFFLTEFNQFLMWPFYKATAEYPKSIVILGTTTVMEGFSMIIQMCVLGGLACSAPFMLFFIGQFVSPALSEKELKAVAPMCLSAFVLFVIGAVFAFVLLVPATIRMAIEINQNFGFEFRWSVGSYYSILSWLVLGVGASFEFPLVIVLLVWLGIVTTAFLKKYRKHAIVVIFIIAAIITPTPDPFVQTTFAAPLYLLYEIAIFVGSRIEKKRAVRLKSA